MIKTIDIRNFRCFERLTIPECRRVNVIVGENGSGKTALLEAIFFALGVTSQLGPRFRQARGLSTQFMGSGRRIEDAIWGDFFYNRDQKRTISVTLSGSGPEARSITISRGSSQSLVTLRDQSEVSFAPLSFQWKDAQGAYHTVTPIVKEGQVSFPETGEDLPDFFFITSTLNAPAIENAERFSDLSREQRQEEFVQLFRDEYSWIQGLSIEVEAGSTDIYASVKGTPVKIALGNVSGGVQRIVSILLAIASRKRSVVLVDEIENGLHHKHHFGFWKALLSFARKYESQLFLTTHNEEWLDALADAAVDSVNDIALWRAERTETGQVVRQFMGRPAVAAMKSGEVR